ncbi:GNAT family N-acetyltransferase [Paramixta manurensis]|uniref:GNAT family N-acetyltransferase n=1 Tax=Paramixta manurensis TaxID=2740817 RepID=A0A6M8UJD8_9GAMM|nr:GNAT family N-acetyltransferase [Erwiniaceae bacterium PD-1]
MTTPGWRIVPLDEAPQHAEQVTDWLWQAFGSENSRAFFASVIHSSLQQADLPQTFVALVGERAVATVGAWRCDLISRQDLFPWLAALYIDNPWRGQGLSEALQQHVMSWCRARGYRQLHLWATFADYYERFGWRYIGEALEYPDKPVRVYHRSLAAD